MLNRVMKNEKAETLHRKNKDRQREFHPLNKRRKKKSKFETIPRNRNRKHEQ